MNRHLLGQQPRPPVYATYDWTPTYNADALRDAWVDVKSPGDGRTYKVGNTEVRTTAATPCYFSSYPLAFPSQFEIQREPLTLPTFTIQGTAARRQVVVVQVTQEGTETILFQKYFYGFSGPEPQNSAATNARAISVWPAATPQDTRVAICGEVYDQTIPLSQAPSGWSAANSHCSSGFIAVYNGDLQMQWSHHLFGNATPECSCAVTDISVRSEENSGQVYDVVTYCGISSFGNPGANSPLSPRLEFSLSPSAGRSSGATNQYLANVLQWDGFVGRVYRGPGALPPEFHSIVGGPKQDGLFGLCELDRDKFAVVGCTETNTQLTGRDFPFTSGAQSGNDTLGTVLLFDASNTRSNGPLHLSSSIWLGDANATSSSRTEVRDICPALLPLLPLWPSSSQGLYLCGATNDPLFTSSIFAKATPNPTPDQEGDGFVAVALVDPNLILPWHALVTGHSGHDAYTGIGTWNEYSDHFTVAGYALQLFGQPGQNNDMIVTSYFFDTSSPTGTPLDVIKKMRESPIGDSRDEFPAVLGHINVMDMDSASPPSQSTPPWNTFTIPLSAGSGSLIGRSYSGGTAVGPRARTNVVGSTESDSIPHPAGRGPDIGQTGTAAARVPDAFRAVIDLLPGSAGRTDGTGDPMPAGLPAGFTGGTSPACALSPFGIRIRGDAAGLEIPGLCRMLIDYEGYSPNGTAINNAAIVVSRPPALNAGLVAALLQFGIPGATPPFLHLPEQIEIWTTDPSATFLFYGSSPDRPFRLAITPSFPPGITVGAQLVVSVLTPFPLPSGCTASGLMAASPAIWITN